MLALRHIDELGPRDLAVLPLQVQARLLRRRAAVVLRPEAGGEAVRTRRYAPVRLRPCPGIVVAKVRPRHCAPSPVRPGLLASGRCHGRRRRGG